MLFAQQPFRILENQEKILIRFILTRFPFKESIGLPLFIYFYKVEQYITPFAKMPNQIETVLNKLNFEEIK